MYFEAKVVVMATYLSTLQLFFKQRGLSNLPKDMKCSVTTRSRCHPQNEAGVKKDL